MLIEPAEDILTETLPLMLGLGRKMTQLPFVVEPDIGSIHAQIQHVVQILAARDPWVERQPAIGLLMDGEAATADMVAARQARARHGLPDPVIERTALLPEAVVPTVLPFGIVGALVIDVVARLGKDGNALLRELAQPVDRLAHERRVIQHLVIIQEDDGFEAQRVRYDQAQIANSAISAQPDLLVHIRDAQLLHPLTDQVELHIADDQRGQLRMRGGDAPDLRGSFSLYPAICCHQYDDEPEMLHPFKGGQASIELAIIIDIRRVIVVPDDPPHLGAPARPGDEGRDDHCWIHVRFPALSGYPEPS